MTRVARCAALLAGALLVGSLAAGCQQPQHHSSPPRSGRHPVATSRTSPPNTSPSPPVATGPPGVPPPADFAPASASFVDANLGFALGVAPCLPQSLLLCSALVRTRDAGLHWQALTSPPLTLTDPYRHAILRFADAVNGFAADNLPGDQLTVTHDGGATWLHVSLPGLANPQVDAIAVGGGFVDVVASDGGRRSLYISPVSVDTFVEISAVRLPAVDAVISIAMAGGRSWLTASPAGVGQRPEYYESDDGVSWQLHRLPCAAGDVAKIAASDALHVVAVCQATPHASAAAKVVYVSTDGGAHYREAGGPGQDGYLAGIAAPSSSVIAVATSADFDSLYFSADAGRTFTLSFSSGEGSTGGGLGLYDLSFVDARHGSAVLGDTGLYARALAMGQHVPPPRLLTTTDGGAHWGQQVIRG